MKQMQSLSKQRVHANNEPKHNVGFANNTQRCSHPKLILRVKNDKANYQVTICQQQVLPHKTFMKV